MDNRVQFRYPLHTKQGTEFEEIPFVIAIIADLSGGDSTRSKRQTLQFVEEKGRGTNGLMKYIAPTLLEGPLKFSNLDDFSPHRIVAQLVSTAATESEEDTAICLRLDKLLHDPLFERLHATWLGIDRVAQTCSEVPAAKLAVLDVPLAKLLFPHQDASGAESLLREIQKALNHLGSDIFGGHPPTALIVDCEFGPDDIGVLNALAMAAHAAGTILVAAASAVFLPQDSFALINDPIRVHHLSMKRFEEWRPFRTRLHAQSAILALPPVLLRQPYENVPLLANGSDVRYNESVDPLSRSGYLWGNAAYAVASLLVKSFGRHGWAASISPLESHGLTLDYPYHRSRGIAAAPQVGPTFMAVWHETAKDLSALGLLPVVECKGTGTVAVFDDHSCYSPHSLPPGHVRSEASPNLLYWLLLNRLKHSFELLRQHRNFTGLAEPELERQVKTWLAAYTAPVDSVDTNDDHANWPIDNYEISSVSHSGVVALNVAAYLNHGSHCSLAHFVIESPAIDKVKPAANGKSTGSFETDVTSPGVS